MNSFRRKSMSDGGTQYSLFWKTRDNSIFLLCPTIRRVVQIQISYHREVCCLLPHRVSVLEWSSYSSGSVCRCQQGEMIGKWFLFALHLHLDDIMYCTFTPFAFTSIDYVIQSLSLLSQVHPRSSTGIVYLTNVSFPLLCFVA